MRSLCIVEVYVIVSSKHYSGLQVNCFYGELMFCMGVKPGR